MKSFISTILAASLSLATIGSAPARADVEAQDVAAVIIGLALFAGIAHAITDDDEPQDRRHHGNRYALPDQCIQEYQTPRHDIVGFGRRCLIRSGVAVDHLPDWCVREVRVHGRSGVVFEQRCMAREGYFATRNYSRHRH